MFPALPEKFNLQFCCLPISPASFAMMDGLSNAYIRFGFLLDGFGSSRTSQLLTVSWGRRYTPHKDRPEDSMYTHHRPSEVGGPSSEETVSNRKQ